MELHEYTDEQLKAELKRRVESRREERRREMLLRDTCRNCQFMVPKELKENGLSYEYWCSLQIVYGRKSVRYKQIHLSNTCERFKRKQF